MCLFSSLLPVLLLSILKCYHLAMAWPLLSLSHTHRRPSEGWGHLTSLMGRREVSLGTHGSSHRVFIFLLFRFFQRTLCFLFPLFPFSWRKAPPEHSCILSSQWRAVLRAVSPTLSVNFYLYLSESTWLHFQILVFCFQKIVKRTWNHGYL